MRPLSLFILFALSILPQAASAATGAEIGSVVALRGSATIERGAGKIAARVKSGLELNDAVATAAASRVKMLFVDDSVLTMGESSRMLIREFVHSRSDRGKSLFNLVDGKMRAVVGKTRFQVLTPTAVAAARGTVIYFETGVMNGRRYTKIISLEGTVEVRSLVAGDELSIELSRGMMAVIFEGDPLSAVKPVQASTEEIQRALEETSTAGSEVSLPETRLPEVLTMGVMDITMPTFVPLIEQQQPAAITVSPPQPTSVNIVINF